MSTRGIFGVLALGLACSLPLAASAAGNAAAGKEKAFLCMGCHGVPTYDTVYPTYHVPKLGGQHAQYIVNALEEYKHNRRAYKTMHGMAVSLSKQDMEDIAAYFSHFPADNH